MARTFYEDYALGDEFLTPARTVTEADVALFAGLSGDYNRLHTDAEYSKGMLFGERIAHGLLGLAIVSGLGYRSGIDPDGALAFLGLTWKFTGPIRFGDTIHAIFRIAALREASKSDRGIVVEAIRVLNQRGEVVQEGEWTFLVKRRGSGG
jgi:acyl dehydratase